ncbi:MAG: hypothetical protein NT023_16930, partial [Armatimonadetes bacterium]|nr:hypothetical protein [Armatimonadota bacterium]
MEPNRTQKRTMQSIYNKTLFNIILLALFFCGASTVVKADTTIYSTGFEDTTQNAKWSADNGVWELGAPTSGPKAAHDGTQVAGTILAGNYPTWKASNLISPSIVLPTINAGEQISLKFWHWFSFGGADSNGRNPSYGHVNVATWDAVNKKWNASVQIPSSPTFYGGSSVWSQVVLDLSSFAGQKIQLQFHHDGQVNSGAGWYIDEVQVIRETIVELPLNIPVTFESATAHDWGGWWADQGVWELGIPTSGPGIAHESKQVAGTVLAGNYPNWQGSGLISPSITLPALNAGEQLSLKFWHWFSYGGADSNGRNPSYGQVHI